MSVVVIRDAIQDTTDHSRLLTIAGIVQGYYSSPLIEKYKLDSLVRVAEKTCASDNHQRAALRDAIALHAKALNIVRKENTATVGSFDVGGIKAPKVEIGEVTREAVAERKKHLRGDNKHVLAYMERCGKKPSSPSLGM